MISYDAVAVCYKILEGGGPIPLMRVAEAIILAANETQEMTMVGSKVRVIRKNSQHEVKGVLRRLDAVGAVVYCDQGKSLFIPMEEILEIMEIS
jgi:hypothetical protein